ncbi:hypothetical protein [Streptantibioticus ferralitis]|uniref:Uncharacterized protein n=1 Tax=Streptantibioticus ferralitis TaxID=236510 RepID=A0ABT5Z2U6_9ACTN|nr:hypothetical protein [Streptantibioticus ferralitis]MDF2258088.1 hypothetical protein [Streptantibioticus ferralitis]
MTDSPVAKRAIFVAAASALAFGAASPLAFADEANRFDSGHLSVNNGASCATKDLTEAGWTVLTTGKLPKAFNNARIAPGGDSVSGLCHAVDSPPPGPHHQSQGLLGGLPVGRH